MWIPNPPEDKCRPPGFAGEDWNLFEMIALNGQVEIAGQRLIGISVRSNE